MPPGPVAVTVISVALPEAAVMVPRLVFGVIVTLTL
jgi:hypothetical protein